MGDFVEEGLRCWPVCSSLETGYLVAVVVKKLREGLDAEVILAVSSDVKSVVDLFQTLYYCSLSCANLTGGCLLA